MSESKPAGGLLGRVIGFVASYIPGAYVVELPEEFRSGSSPKPEQLVKQFEAEAGPVQWNRIKAN